MSKTDSNRKINVERFNADAWDHHVEIGIEWTIPVSSDQIEKARNGEWSVILTATRPVPMDWFLPMKGADVLCLAGGGGQQGPIFAAAGANVIVYDNSPAQLKQDEMVAKRDGLKLKTMLGDMRDLSQFADESFDMVFHPVSNCYVSEVQPIWEESYRVLRPGGVLLAGFVQPLQYIFDFEKWEQGELVVTKKLPYSDVLDSSDEAIDAYVANQTPLEFSHYLEELIGGQMKAGFVLSGYYDDRDSSDILSEHIPVYSATRAIKMKF